MDALYVDTIQMKLFLSANVCTICARGYAASSNYFHLIIFMFLVVAYDRSVLCFQCFDAVGWAAGRASGL